MSLFSPVELAPRDPILGLNEAFNADTRANKVNLGVGVYCNEAGKVPLLRAVQAAEEARVAEHAARAYLPIDGLAPYDLAVQKLLFGADSALLDSGRLITAQALGGTGALKLGADFLYRLTDKRTVAISNPSWENHRALFEAAGYDVVNYTYFDPATNGLNLDGMLADLDALPEGSVVILHACCHNPTGVDLSLADWAKVIDVVGRRQLVPFLDIAYQGFGENLEDDAVAVRLFAESGLPFLVASSFSKSFSLYGERVGALTMVTASKEETAPVLSQLKRVIRTNYSNPPTHGAKVVAAVLTNPELYAQWEDELAEMRDRIRDMRAALVEKLRAAGVEQDVSFIQRQRGMFSFSGLSKDQVARLADEFGIYAVGSGRICVAALNTSNIDAVATAMAAVMKG
ncbi:aromatic amino acid aminotransferase [Halopseudomonas pachastrellae]|uniref:Aminotransferase n=1 Tax=Halopseudomonas pachastrellae TaxID=254161 RepID=A0A1S8DFS7_9GAMM|nr:amino acid aminotransferase [Halopseudomonas pachastrellae]ONM43666.1 aromatic amino acid aminotransferase [Halopseudomonas pachastrellae]SFM16651.1 aromatic-amino-acid transaminase [Halopseudomonas pachastrellae]